MRAIQTPIFVAAMAIAGSVACSPRSDATDSARARDTTAADSIQIGYERDGFGDLTGDVANEKIIVTARGHRIDSLRVRLEIRGAGDSVLYASSWNSSFYFQYLDRAAMSDAAADSTVRRHLAAILVDSASRVGGRGSPTDTMHATMM